MDTMDPLFMIGHKFMEKRPAYSLKGFLILYNIFQVLICLYLINIIHSNIAVLKFWQCAQYSSYSNEEKIIRNLSYTLFFVKLIELSETFVFVLRKKQNQISRLHVFHHIATSYLTYILVRHQLEGRGMFTVYINCWVHVIMYTYYLLTAILDKKTLQKIGKVKQLITIVQMAQFVLILTQNIVQTVKSCEPSITLILTHFILIFLMLIMFYDFYKTTYKKKQEKKVQ